MDNVEKNYKYFKDNLQNFLNEHKNKYVVIYNCSDVGFFDTFDEALSYATAHYELGSYLVQKCTDKPEEDAAVFYSRVGGVGFNEFRQI